MALQARVQPVLNGERVLVVRVPCQMCHQVSSSGHKVFPTRLYSVPDAATHLVEAAAHLRAVAHHPLRRLGDILLRAVIVACGQNAPVSMQSAA